MIKYSDIELQVGRLIEELLHVALDLDRLRQDPVSAIPDHFEVEVELRQRIEGRCGIAGAYYAGRGLIVVEESLSPARVRFTALHELAHVLGYQDAIFQDWIFSLEDEGRLAEERVADAFAAEILLPSLLVSEMIPPEGPSASHVHELWRQAKASREAVCVRASQRLRSPGIVAVAKSSVILFAATRQTTYQLPRDSDQGPGSFVERASSRDALRGSGVEVISPDGELPCRFLADAVRADDGYIFLVFHESGAPWITEHSGAEDPEFFEVDCVECDRTRFTLRAACLKCGDHPCPDHGCSCHLEPFRDSSARHCQKCHIELPKAAPATARFCDRHD
jgi:Zn-dependent peptidase ImmA (M78 family)